MYEKELRLSKMGEEPEIFKSIQGEGRYANEECGFIRLAGCNLRCEWCDSSYTWDFKQFDKQAETMQLETGKAIDLITGLEVDRLVITGGEPLLQQDSIIELLEPMRAENPDFWTEVETNGTIKPKDELNQLIDQYNVSIKLSNSGNELYKSINDEALVYFINNPKADFKFVVGGANDFSEIDALVHGYEIPKDRVFIMPEGKTKEEQIEKMAIVHNLATSKGYQFTPRYHVLKWGDKRGV